MIAAVRWVAWVGMGAIAVLLLTQPISVQTQFQLSVTIIVALIGVWIFGRGQFARQLFLALGSFVVIRYLYWRYTSTLPPITDFPGFELGLLLVTAETYCVLILVISLIISADPLVRKPR